MIERTAGSNLEPEDDTSVWQAFLAGLTSPSRLSLLTIVSVNVVVFLGLGTWFTPEKMAGDLPGYVSGRQGGDEFTTRNALRLLSGTSRQPFVVVIGASAVRECFDEDDLRSEFEAIDPLVYNLATGRQSIYDSIGLASCLPEGARGVVFLGIGPTRLSRPPSVLAENMRSPRVGMRFDVVDKMAREQGLKVPLRVGNYAIDNVRFFAPRIKYFAFRAATRRPLVYRQHWYLNAPQQTGKAWLKFNTRVAGRFAGYEENVSHNLGLFERLVSALRDRTRVQIVLIEHPINPNFVKEFMDPELMRRHSDKVAAFAAQHGLPVVDLGEAARLQEEEYYDWCHLRDRQAIARCAAVAAGEAIPLLMKGEDQ